MASRAAAKLTKKRIAKETTEKRFPVDKIFFLFFSQNDGLMLSSGVTYLILEY